MAQELPPVSNYSPNQYTGGNQNWGIAQGENNNIYFANSSGLLEFNGEYWNLYPVPNNTIVRSVKIVNNRIYTGSYMEVGFWTPNDYGKLVYTSLIDKFPAPIKDGEQFWEIEYLDNLVIFRSFIGIYFYNPKENSITQLENPANQPVTGIFKLNGHLYYQLSAAGLYEINNSKSQLVIPPKELKEIAIMDLYDENGTLKIVSAETKFYTWDGVKLKPNFQDLQKQLGAITTLTAIHLPQGGLILGTVGKGLLQISPKGQLINTFNQKNILLNNTVLDLYLGKSGTIWAGLDYGISMIDPSSSYRFFKDINGEIGSVYSSLENNGDLYLGTNQGLYVRKKRVKDFKLIEGTNGQVWNVQKIAGKIFCSHNSGTFLIKEDKAKKICDRLGTWLVKEYKKGVFVQGHYNGISFLKEKNGKLQVTPMLKDFPHSSKNIEVGKKGEIWVSNEHKGIFRMTVSDSLTNIESIKNYTFTKESGISSSIFKFNDSLYYSSKEKIYKYESKLDSFSSNNSLNKVTANINRISGRMIAERDGAKVWGFSKNGIFNIRPAPLRNTYNLDFVYVDQAFRNIALGYENIAKVKNSQYLLGIANGYLRLTNFKEKSLQHKIKITQINARAINANFEAVKLTKSASFKATHNNISFSYTVPVYKSYLNATYSYRLRGQNSRWSEWEQEATANFKNLSWGDYTFQVKAKVGNEITNIAKYSFIIERPFYLSTFAIIAYVFLFILILIAMHLLNKNHHKKMLAEKGKALKLRNLEAEQEIIKLKNEKLEQDMANKNRELAVSTMSLIKKNEFLTSIKEKLKTSEESSKIHSVIKTIDKDINEKDNWKFFEKAFNNADRDFLKKIKQHHPELTSSDLKLCAYLRLNLSSKEIAPLLNISVKSVEIKRYRLRKKMNLDRNVNLTDYILEI